jgi:hypothetical protein
VSIKLVVSGSSEESRIALIGRTGKELLVSTTFSEPRAKGATLRALKKILGDDVAIEDRTTTNRRSAKPVAADGSSAATVAVTAPPAAKQTAAAAHRVRQRPALVVTAPPARKATKRAVKVPRPD